MLGFVGGVAYFGTLETDPMKPILVLLSSSSLSIFFTNNGLLGHRPILFLWNLHAGLRWYAMGSYSFRYSD